MRKGMIHILLDEFPHMKVTEASGEVEVMNQVSTELFDVILLDVSMPGRGGLDLLKQWTAAGLRTPVIVLSLYSDDQYALRAIKAGASGYLGKDSKAVEILRAVDSVLNGKKYIAPNIAEKLVLQISSHHDRMPHEMLSNRELQVLQFIGSGNTISEIAETISLSVNTVSTYRARILEKLALSNNAELTRYCIDHKLSA